MAASSATLNNFLSFFLPTRHPPPPSLPPTQLNLPPQPSPYPSHTLIKPSHNPNLVPLVPEDSSSFSSSSDLSSVICPSLAYSNTLFFRSPYNVQVVVGADEPEEKLVNRFRREVLKAGVIQECRRRRYFENKQDERKRKSQAASKRNRRRRPTPKTSSQKK